MRVSQHMVRLAADVESARHPGVRTLPKRRLSTPRGKDGG